MSNKIILLVIILFSLGSAHSQTKSIPDKDQTALIIQKVLALGCHIEKCDSTDPTCPIVNADNKRTYEELKQPNVNVVRMFSPMLKDTIDSKTFYEHYDRYFDTDTNSYTIYFTKWENGKHLIFGSSNYWRDKSNVFSYAPIVAESWQSDKNAFLNLPESGGSLLIFNMSFDATMFVSGNQIKIIVNNEVVDAATFFGKYDLPAINFLFKSSWKGIPVN